MINWLTFSSYSYFTYKVTCIFFLNFIFQMKFLIQNIIQVPYQLLWMKRDWISYSKVAHQICRNWVLQCQVFKRFNKLKMFKNSKFGGVVWIRTMHLIDWLTDCLIRLRCWKPGRVTGRSSVMRSGLFSSCYRSKSKIYFQLIYCCAWD